MSITGTAAQGQHPCWDVKESYCRADWASTLIHAICMSLVYWGGFLATDYMQGGWCHLAPLVWGQIKCYEAQISSASLATLQLKNETCPLVGKVLEMKALPYPAICMSCWRIQGDGGGGRERHTYQGKVRKMKKQCGRWMGHSGPKYPFSVTLCIIAIKSKIWGGRFFSFFSYPKE